MNADEILSMSATTCVRDSVVVHSESSDGPGLMKPKCDSFEIGEADNNASTDVPDGGWTAWGTVLACFVAHVVCFGPEYSYGVFTTYYLDRGLGSASAISIVGGLGAASVNGFGVLSTFLMAKFGYQRMVLIGATLYMVGFVAASFSGHSLALLCLTQSFLYGLGASFAYYPALSLPNQYFSKKRGIATGLGVAGAGLGGVIYSVGAQQLLNAVGFEWSMRIMGLVSFVALCAIAPLVKERVSSNPTTGTQERLGFFILKDAKFTTLLVCILFFCLSFYIPTYYLPDFAVTQLGIDPTPASYLLTAHNGAAILGRLSIGFIADLAVGRINTLLLVIFTHSLSTLIWYYAHTLQTLYAFTLINGFVSGAYWVAFPVSIAEVFGVARLGPLVGVLYSMNALGALCGPAAAGAFRDSVGYAGLILFCGGLTMVSGLFALCARLLLDANLWKRL
ncbi:major facilitator superfamily domain-containing protein [Chytriomyces sp. MP71]|nr:major facilitator superfamily domain-containing protein [Chytriomyces sp. MP71]